MFCQSQKHCCCSQGKSIGLSGRDLFTFNPDLVREGDQDDDEVDDAVAEREENAEDEEVVRKMRRRNHREFAIGTPGCPHRRVAVLQGHRY